MTETRRDTAARTIEASVLDALASSDAADAPDAWAILFLLRQYQITARDDLGEIAGRALALALDDRARAVPPADGAARLVTFVEARALSDDDRLQPAIDDLIAQLRPSWASPSVDAAAEAIDACLHAASLPACRSLASDAIDALEQMIGRAYRPGEGVGEFAAQVAAASALLTGYAISGRLPYSMLAEELIQLARRGTPGGFVASCKAARVLCRLAALHDDEDYRRAAVVAPDADYRRDAARLLTSQREEAQRRGAAGAIYGVALLELESPGPRP